MTPTVAALQERKTSLITYLRMKIDANDFHGVADAAMDIREIDAQVELLRGLDQVFASDSDRLTIHAGERH